MLRRKERCYAIIYLFEVAVSGGCVGILSQRGDGHLGAAEPRPLARPHARPLPRPLASAAQGEAVGGVAVEPRHAELPLRHRHPRVAVAAVRGVS